MMNRGASMSLVSDPAMMPSSHASPRADNRASPPPQYVHNVPTIVSPQPDPVGAEVERQVLVVEAEEEEPQVLVVEAAGEPEAAQEPEHADEPEAPVEQAPPKRPHLMDVDTLTPAELKHRLWDARKELEEQDARITQLQSTVRQLATRFNRVSDFVDAREDIEECLEQMERMHQAEVDRCRAEVTEARLEMLENRVHLRAVEEEVRRTQEEDVNRRATELLDARTREVNNQNFELIKDKILLSKDAEEAKASAAVMQREHATLKQKLELACVAEAELLSRSVAQRKEVAALKKQIKTSEDNFSRLIDEYEERLRKQEADYSKRLSQTTRERDEARSDARRLQADLVRLKKASAAVVQQRGDLETFFYEALNDVRAQVLEERRRLLLADAAPSNGTFAASHTASSAMRLESQKQRLRITNGVSTLPTSTFHNATNRGKRAWGTDSKGLPVLLDNSKVSGKALPPIPPSNSGGARGAAGTHEGTAGHVRAAYYGQLSHSGGGIVGEVDHDDGAAGYGSSGGTNSRHNHTQHGTQMGNTTMGGTGSGGMSTLRDAPTWKEIQTVDIRDLDWPDKERVIMLLFKRIQQQQSYLASRRNRTPLIKPPEASEAVFDGVQPGKEPDSDSVLVSADEVFLTQQ